MNLKTRFSGTLKHWTSDEAHIQKLWLDLERSYSQKFRAYHNLEHLEELFGYFDRYQSQIEAPELLAFAIFYHDVVYSIWKRDNEARSADLAISILKELNASARSCERVNQLIMATRNHKATDNDSAWMIDFDLAVLGQSETTYLEYAQKIRKEYRKVPNVLYKPGRKKVLEHFLQKENIYATETFRMHFEAQARKNLTNELQSLS